MKYISLYLAFFICSITQAQVNPAISSWILNTTGQTGFGGIPTNVQLVQYSDDQVYITTTDIADWIPVGYDWPSNPWFPEDQSFVFKITLHPEMNPGMPVKTPFGHIGIWTNGVSIYNPKDTKSWQSLETWYQNAIYFEHLETETMDSCLGHPNNMHEYHLHVHPPCLYDETNNMQHSPIIGFAFDGFPIYGAYGYTNPDGTGPVKRMIPSFRLRDISARTTLPDGTELPADLYGPSLSEYPLGAYVEDFEYLPGSGDLDYHNGRFCVTPEYPDGIYAYFVTLDSLLEPAFPYVLGPTYYGKVQPGNTGPDSGHNMVDEQVNIFTNTAQPAEDLEAVVYPNPASDFFYLYISPQGRGEINLTFSDSRGALVRNKTVVFEGIYYRLDISDLQEGLYFLSLQTDNQAEVVKIMVSGK